MRKTDGRRAFHQVFQRRVEIGNSSIWRTLYETKFLVGYSVILRMKKTNGLLFLFVASISCLFWFYWFRLISAKPNLANSGPCSSCIEEPFVDQQKVTVSRTSRNGTFRLFSPDDEVSKIIQTVQRRIEPMFWTNEQLAGQDIERQKKDSLPELAVDDRYISVEEIRRNATLLRLSYYDHLPYSYVKYQKTDPICGESVKEIPQTTNVIRKRQYMAINWEYVISFLLNNKIF